VYGPRVTIGECPRRIASRFSGVSNPSPSAIFKFRSNRLAHQPAARALVGIQPLRLRNHPLRRKAAVASIGQPIDDLVDAWIGRARAAEGRQLRSVAQASHGDHGGILSPHSRR
jgi:hypothetical protein